MKKFTAILATLVIAVGAFAQERLPEALASQLKEGEPAIISFWSLTCKPCILELNALSENYPDWYEECPFTVIAVSIDDARSSSKVKSFAEGKGWSDFTILLDPNQELNPAMNVATMPTVFLVDAEGKVVYRHMGYNPGGENELFEKIKELQ